MPENAYVRELNRLRRRLDELGEDIDELKEKIQKPDPPKVDPKPEPGKKHPDEL